jgi:hypothetical protein
MRERRDRDDDPAQDLIATKKKRVQSCTPLTASDGKGRTAGNVVRFWGCGFMFPPPEMILMESTTVVSSKPPRKHS